MSYFKNVKSLSDLKKQFQVLAKSNHPDCGGKLETMQAINVEYDALFRIWKTVQTRETGVETNETAYSTRSEFYTQNGWKGDNYNSSLSLKEIAKIVRTYVKEKYSTYRFSVTTSYASMCQELHVSLTQAPYGIYKALENYTQEDIDNTIHKANKNCDWKLNCWSDDEAKEEIKRLLAENSYYEIYTDEVKTMLDDVDSFVNSYNFSDCDGQIDYFHVGFYYFDCKPYDLKIVPKTEKKKATKTIQEPSQAEYTQETQEEQNTIIDNLTYEITEDTDTRDNSKIYLVKVVEKLSRDEYLKVNSYMKSIGGYYSKFKHAFLVRENPTDILNMNTKETNTKEHSTDTDETTNTIDVLESDTVAQDNAIDTNNTNNTNSTKNTIEYEIEESKHTKTGETIFLVKPKTNLSKDKFAEVKKQLATLKGFYSSFTHSFVFKYDPTEKLLI